MRERQARSTGLVDELQRSHRFVLGVLVAVLLLSLTTSGYLILVSQPRVSMYVELARQSRDAHEGMLDQETGLRAWLATGQERFLQPYSSGLKDTKEANAGLLVDVRKTPELTDRVLSMLLASQRWEGWATEAAGMRLTTEQLTDGTLTRFLLRGKGLFDAYRVTEADSINVITERRVSALSEQTHALELTLLSFLVMLTFAGIVTVRRRRRLQATIIEPIEDLRRTIVRLRAGDLTALAEPTDVPELTDIGSALGGLASDLAWAEVEGGIREQRLTSLAERFETVVTVGREIAGSLSVRYVSITVTTAAAELLGTSTVLWLRSESGAFEATHRSTDPHGVAPPAGLTAPDLVARAAADAHTLSDQHSRAYPLVLAGTVTGVLEVATGTVDPDTEQVLDSLLSTAAAALESAHLHSTARELADHDGLTQLPNRRRFEVDVDTEWERCRRYGRPMSLVMLDLDHFKRFNDEHGHLLGDQVLREVATAISSSLRTTDTAYRYGGEELVVILRETGLPEAAAVSERLRRAVFDIELHDHPTVRVSTSVGVATRHSRMQHHTDLVATADRALYEAKELGRNQVVTAGAEGETLFHGGAADAPEPLLRL